MKPNLVITGASGFTGSHLVEGALSKDYAAQVLASMLLYHMAGWHP